MSKETLATLAAAVVRPIAAGNCLDHCGRGIELADGLQRLGIAGKVEIVQALVDGQDAGKPRKLLHCWVEVEQSGQRMVLDAIANRPITTVTEYYQDRNPTDVKRYSPAEMRALLTKEGWRAGWFGRSAQEIAQYTGTPTPAAPSSPKSGADQTSSPAGLDEDRVRVEAFGIYERRMQAGEFWGTPDGDWREALRRLRRED